jgi:hypothetical protein
MAPKNADGAAFVLLSYVMLICTHASKLESSRTVTRPASIDVLLRCRVVVPTDRLPYL